MLDFESIKQIHNAKNCDKWRAITSDKVITQKIHQCPITIQYTLLKYCNIDEGALINIITTDKIIKISGRNLRVGVKLHNGYFRYHIYDTINHTVVLYDVLVSLLLQCKPINQYRNSDVSYLYVICDTQELEKRVLAAGNIREYWREETSLFSTLPAELIDIIHNNMLMLIAYE